MQLQRARVIIAGISALVLTVGLARFAYTPLLPIMQAEAGLSYLAGGWLATINYAGYLSGAITAMFIRSLPQKFLVYRAGLILGVIGTAGMGLTDNLVYWGILRYIAGFASTAGLLLASGLVLNWLIRHDFKQQLGLHFAGLGLGIAVSGLAVALLSPAYEWDQQWLWLGVMTLVLLLPAWFWLPAPVPVSAGSGASADFVAPARSWLALSVAAYCCAGFGFVIGATFIVSILEQLPVFAGQGGWVWVVVGVAATPSTFLWDRIATRFSVTDALMLAYALQVVSILLPVFSEGAVWNLFAAALFGGTFVGIVSLTLTAVGKRYPHNPAKAMAGMTLGYGVSQIVAPAIAGYVAEFTGSYRDMLWFTAAVLGIGIILLYRLKLQEQAI